MTAERWQQIKTIFDSAVDIDPAERGEFLRQSCGSDGELRREVESLLAFDVEPSSVLERPIVGAAAMVAAPGRAATLVLKDRYEVAKPDGAFYLLPKAPRGTGTEFVAEAIRNNLLVIPGNVFSRRDTHFRISYAADDRTLERGIEILNRLAR